MPLWELAESGYEANWFWIASHAAGLGRDILRRILALPGDLWLDVCGTRSDEEASIGVGRSPAI